jgi:hypothetical protein
MESAGPTVLWRLFRSPGHRSLGEGGAHVRAVLLPGGPPYTLSFFADDQLDRAENYDTIELAMFRADEIRRSLAADGWSEDS